MSDALPLPCVEVRFSGVEVTEMEMAALAIRMSEARTQAQHFLDRDLG